MSETVSALSRKIRSVHDLQAVVHTMKAIAAANITHCEHAVESLALYARTVELGLTACLLHAQLESAEPRRSPPSLGVLVFGSDQGMVGQFNEQLAAVAAGELRNRKVTLWAVGERIRARLEEAGFTPERLYPAPSSVAAITPLVGEIVLDIQHSREVGQLDELLIFHNRPKSKAGFEPSRQRLLPLDEQSVSRWRATKWPSNLRPVVLFEPGVTLVTLVREFLFVSLFQACAESLAAENASRLAAIQKAEHNIGERLADLRSAFNRRRQSAIDAELFDLVAGFEALFPGAGQAAL